ncbi:MAG TPA: RNase H family protein [Rubrobacter sp.]|nr:RNase H family protein [Rubrobacter sp.]
MPLPEPQTQEAYAYTDGASTGSRGPGGYGAVLTWKGKTEEISGCEQEDTTNLRMELTAACEHRRHHDPRWAPSLPVVRAP